MNLSTTSLQRTTQIALLRTMLKCKTQGELDRFLEDPVVVLMFSDGMCSMKLQNVFCALGGDPWRLGSQREARE